LNLTLYYVSFALGTLAGSSFLYSVVIYSQAISNGSDFSGLVFFVLFLGFPLFFYPAGHLLDAYPKKAVLFGFQFLLFGNVLCLALGEVLGLGKIVLILSAFLTGLGMACVLPGRMAILRELAPVHRLVFHTVSGNLVLIATFGLSPFAVGFLRKELDFANVFLCLGGLHLVSLFFLSFVSVERISVPRNAPFSEFLTFVRDKSLILQIYVTAIFSMLALGPIQVLLPLYVKKSLGLGDLERGILLSLLGPGLFLGGIVSLVFHHREGKGLVLLFMLVASSVIFLFFVPFLSIWITGFSLVLFGFLGGVVSSLLPALLQKHSPDQLRGRVLSVYMVAFQFTPAVSGFLSAKLESYLGMVFAFNLLGVSFLFLGLYSLLFFRDLRKA